MSTGAFHTDLLAMRRNICKNSHLWLIAQDRLAAAVANWLSSGTFTSGGRMGELAETYGLADDVFGRDR